MNQLKPLNTTAIEITATSLRFVDTITDEEIAQARHTIEEAAMHINWIYGDFYSEVARVRPNQRVSDRVDDGQLHFTMQVEQCGRVQAMMEDSQQTRSLSRTVCRVSQILSSSDRIPNLSWGHHECALAECGLLGGENLEGGEYDRRKAEAIAFLKWAENERGEGELVPVSDFRKVIRLRREDARGGEGVADDEPPVRSAVGDVLRESVSYLQSLNKVDPKKLEAGAAKSLAHALDPLVAFHRQLLERASGL